MAAKFRRKRIPGADSPSGLAFTDRDQAVTDWQIIRAWVLKRDNHICQICFLQPATDVDHIWPRRLGGTDHVDNLRAACGRCNKAKGPRVAIGTASQEQLLQGIEALCSKINDLRREKKIFERALIENASRQDMFSLLASLRREYVKALHEAGERVADLDKLLALNE